MRKILFVIVFCLAAAGVSQAAPLTYKQKTNWLINADTSTVVTQQARINTAIAAVAANIMLQNTGYAKTDCTNNSLFTPDQLSQWCYRATHGQIYTDMTSLLLEENQIFNNPYTATDNQIKTAILDVLWALAKTY